jgi:hypothetical protein
MVDDAQAGNTSDSEITVVHSYKSEDPIDLDDAYNASPDLSNLETAAAMIRSRDFEAIDPHGDLYLEVGADPLVFFQVESERLRRARFQTLKGSRRPIDRPWIVRLPGDPAALRFLFHILHGNNEQIPLLASPEANFTIQPYLWALVDCANKFCSIEILQPWAWRWALDCRHVATIVNDAMSIGQKDDSQLLFVAWELGDIPLFGLVVAGLAKNYEATMDYQEVHRRIPRLEGEAAELQHGFTANILIRIELVRNVRNGLVKAMLKPFRKLDDGCARQIFSCRNSSTFCDCDIIIRGSIKCSLAKEQLWPLPRPTEMDISVWELFETLAKIRYYSFCGGTCSATVEQAVKSRMDVACQNFELPAEMSNHLTQRGIQSGLITIEE